MTEAITDILEAIGDYDDGADEVITPSAKRILMFSFMRGYALRLASDRAIEVVVENDDPEIAAIELMNQASDDDWFYHRAFPQGRRVWEPPATAFAEVANAMLLEDQPDGPIFPPEVIDHMVRSGYMGGHVDEWFGLRPFYFD